MKNYSHRLAILLSCYLTILSSCGGGLYTNQPDGLAEYNSAAAPFEVRITKNAFLFASDFPSDIVIPNIEEMSDTAFVVSGSSPAGVIAINLTTNPLSLSEEFKGLSAPAGTGYPSNLYILSGMRAFLLTSSHVIDFNPTTGAVNKVLPLSYKVSLLNPMPLSDSKKNVTSIQVSYPAAVVSAESKLFITTSNYINPLSPAVSAPGTILVFDMFDAEPFLKIRTYILTTDYNPTGMTILPDGKIAVTNSGISDLYDAKAHPKTSASIDILDPAQNKIVANIPIGMAGLSFQELALTSDGKRGFIGSISFGEIYELDLENYMAVHDHSTPIIITGTEEGSDYLPAQAISHDDKYLFISSFDNSAVYPVDISADPPKTMPGRFSVEPFLIGFTEGATEENPSGGNTGAGPIAIRPGSPGIDFDGPEIFVLTGYPGTLTAIATNSQAELEEAKPEGDDGDEADENTVDGNTADGGTTYETTNEETAKPCTGFATAVGEANISAGGGLNYLKLPDVALGPPTPENNAYGKAGASGTISGAVSIGPGGSIVLDMEACKIIDGDGPDFIVFENAFFIVNSKTPLSVLPQKAIDTPEDVYVFAEPAQVSVSEDGATFYPFPCNPDIPHTPIGAVTFYDGLQSGCAGVTPVLYGRDPLVAGLENGAGGDAFDLAEIGIKRARYVKIVSAGEYKDPPDPKNIGYGNANAGSDLDAVAVINGSTL